jgi:hypothetical protein
VVSGLLRRPGGNSPSQEVEATRARGINTGRFLAGGPRGDLDHFPPLPVLVGKYLKVWMQKSSYPKVWIGNLMPWRKAMRTAAAGESGAVRCEPAEMRIDRWRLADRIRSDA